MQLNWRLDWLSNEPHPRHQDLDHGNQWYAHHDWMNLNGPKINEWTIKNDNDQMKWLDGMMRLEMDPIQPWDLLMNQRQKALINTWTNQCTMHKWVVVPQMKLRLWVSTIKGNPN